jgi:SDR family mycofactocin-dependent oxidoreductase
MAGRVAGKVAFVTGAGRGQGRSHAVRLAAEGADIIAVDICESYETVPYPGATPEDLAETAAAVEALDRRVVALQADIRDAGAMASAVALGMAELGRLDIVVANAAICTLQRWEDITPAVWQDTIDTNLTGAWHTISATAPHLVAAGSGSIICTGSTGAIRGLRYLVPYVAAKHGLVGLVKAMASELGQHGVRVNMVHPGGVNTVMGLAMGEATQAVARSGAPAMSYQTALPNGLAEPVDISNAVLYFASDESRHVTGHEIVVDAGATV